MGERPRSVSTVQAGRCKRDLLQSGQTKVGIAEWEKREPGGGQSDNILCWLHNLTQEKASSTFDPAKPLAEFSQKRFIKIQLYSKANNWAVTWNWDLLVKSVYRNSIGAKWFWKFWPLKHVSACKFCVLSYLSSLALNWPYRNLSN